MTTNLPASGEGNTGSGSTGGLSVRSLAGVVAVAALIALVYHQTFVTMWRTWGTNPNYSHGYLIPPVVAFLLWRERRRFLEARSRGSLRMRCSSGIERGWPTPDGLP